MFRQTRPRWQGLNCWQQKLQGNSTEADLRSIHHAVQSDPTIMVIGRPIVKGEDHSKRSIMGCEDSVVISCITYQNGIGDKTGLSLLLWHLIAEFEAQNHPF
jgi:hypothetical protein